MSDRTVGEGAARHWFEPRQPSAEQVLYSVYAYRIDGQAHELLIASYCCANCDEVFAPERGFDVWHDCPKGGLMRLRGDWLYDTARALRLGALHERGGEEPLA